MEKSDDGRAWQSYQTAYTTAKAGMEVVDKEKVQRVVYEMSKGSKYFENEERKDREIKQKIDNMRTRCMNLSAKDLVHYEKVAEKRILYLDATRDLSRIWLHVDMDAFFAAVETLSNPSLNGKPMAVGSMSMISTANYEARKFGVRSAMPGFIAIRLCPELIFVTADFKKYTYYSDLTRKVFQRYDANFTAASLDEAYLDISSVCKEKGFSSEEIAHELRSSVYEETGLTCSAGVAPNRLLAKVCSDINKPNGQFVLPNHRAAVMAFVSSLPIRKIGGIGRVTEHILRDALGINTCEDMIKKGGQLCALFSNSTAGIVSCPVITNKIELKYMPTKLLHVIDHTTLLIQEIFQGKVNYICRSHYGDDRYAHSSLDFFLSVGLGLGGTEAPEVRLRKSISNERTFRATNNEKLFYRRLAELSEMLSGDMQKESLCGRTLTLKLKTESFEVRTRAVTLQKYISSSDDILQHASKLLKAELPLSLRLIGLRISQFKDDEVNASCDPTQKTLREFIVSEDHSMRKEGGQFPSDLSGHLINDKEKGFFGSSLEICEGDFEDKNVNNSSKMNNDDFHFDLEKCECSSSGLSSNKVDKSYEMRCTETPCETESSDRMTTKSNSRDEVLSRRTEQILWVDDYMCSLCGVELPPSFVQERQEHSDFHIAEKLQQEESGSRSIFRQRIESDDRAGGKRKPKRQKPSAKESGHIPIDMFFARTKSIQD